MASNFAGASAGLLGLVVLTWLLITRNIGEGTYAILVPFAILSGLAIATLSRLQMLDLKNLRLHLRELQEIQEKVERTKAEVVEMYGGIENIRKAPFILDEAKQAELGIGSGLSRSSAIARYVAGCMTRERERLARIFVNQGSPEETAGAMVDGSLNDRVFKWNGPESPLDTPPKSLSERAAAKAAKLSE